MTRMPSVAVALLLLLLAGPATAQEQRASIEGTVRDSSGGVLPGVTVEARSPSLAGVQSTVTDSSGTYRFPALRPGRYEVTATLQGFQPAKSADVRLELGQVLKVDLAMARRRRVRDRQGHRRVAAHRRQAERRPAPTSQAETIERIPKGRDFAALVTSAPGITSEARNRGIQIDGASGADNRFMIDGVDTTNLLNGTSGKALAAGLRRTRCRPRRAATPPSTAPRSAASSAPSPSRAATAITASAGIYYTGDNLQGDVRADAAPQPVESDALPSTSRRRSTTTRARSRSSTSAARSSRTGCGSTSATIRAGPTARARCASTAPSQLGTFSQKPIRPASSTTTSPARSPTTCAAGSPPRTSATRAAIALPASGPNGVSTSNPALFPSVDPPRLVRTIRTRASSTGSSTTRPTST